MNIYQVYIKDTDSMFFHGESFDQDQAIESANSAYYSKYPECIGDIVEWSVSVMEENNIDIDL